MQELETTSRQWLRQEDTADPGTVDLGQVNFPLLDRNTCRLFRVSCLTYEKDFPRQEAFENVVASINNVPCRLVYYLRGVDEGVEFYIGVVNTSGKTPYNMGDYGNMLYRAFKGNFLGSELQEVGREESKKLLDGLCSPEARFSALLGVPTRNSEREDIAFQGVDRLVNIMTSGGRSLGQRFHLLVIWESVARDTLLRFEELARDIYSQLSARAKRSHQEGSQTSSQTGTSTQTTDTKGKSISRTSGTSQGINWSEGSSKGKNISRTSGTSEGINWSEGSSKGKNISRTSGTSQGINWSEGSNGSSSSSSKGGSEGTSSSETGGTSESCTITRGGNKGTSSSETGGTSESHTATRGGSEGTSSSETDGTSESRATTRGTSSSRTETSSSGSSWEELDKRVIDAMKSIDEELLPRIRRGLAKGMYQTAVYVGAETPLEHDLLKNALISICQGDKPTIAPLRAQALPGNEVARRMLAGLGIHKALPEMDSFLGALESRPALSGKSGLATLLTAAEISMLAGMPQKEVPGLGLREQVGFGLNLGSIMPEDALPLGHMKQEGNLLRGRVVSLDRRELSKHVFIAGTTGSGKTTTCHKLLASSTTQGDPLPFLVIEPAKTEYRALLQDSNLRDIVIFTVGSERGVPFRFNPFEFLPQESLSGHVDLLKACFMASFDMEAAIPNLLEEGLYRVYEAYGWDFRTENNRYLKDRAEAWNCGGRYFPTISSYIDIVVALVDNKGFDERLRNDYKGSIRARLDSLRAGAKGLMLDTPLSVDFMQLIERNVVLELEQLKSGDDKAFLMGLVLGRVAEALKQRHAENPAFRHVTLLEEAHRLLSRPQVGDSPSRKLGVETFTDLLAEIRKYGESLIIVDQIPNKLAPEVLKNTNTKIIHKLFARDDKDAVGDTMALDDKQKNYLSHLEPGEAIIFSQGWKKPVDVQVEALPVSTTDKDVPPAKVRKAGWAYWENAADRFCPGLPPQAASMPQASLLAVAPARDAFLDALLADADERALSAWEELGRLLGEQREAYLHCQIFRRSSKYDAEWAELDARLEKLVGDLPRAVNDGDFARLANRLREILEGKTL